MQFPVKLTSKFLKRSYAKRMFGEWWKVAIAAALVGIVAIWELSHGPIGTISLFALSALALYIVIFGLAWFRQSKALDDWLRRQASAPVIYSLSEATIESSSEVGSTQLRWDAFRCLYISEFDTLLKFSQQGALTLPTDQIPIEALEFLKKQFIAHAKEVDDRRKKG